ncbi:hypothetical protein [Ekhidna sp.]|uniref:hypothetical protein n=1 Tax=Ekhidna sp. TaxID=2608089 RepID=UPI003299FF93
MKKITFVTLTILTTLFTVSCSNQRDGQNEYTKAIEEEAKVKFLDPDNFFADAIVEFEKGNTASTIADINEAQEALREITLEGDTVYADIIEFQISELEDLRSKISNGSDMTSNELRGVFASTDISIGTYNLMIIEDWVLNETKDQESLKRMHSALVRAEYAFNHSNLIMSEEDSKKLNQAKVDVTNAEKASHTLWKTIKKRLTELDKQLEASENPLDGGDVL